MSALRPTDLVLLERTLLDRVLAWRRNDLNFARSTRAAWHRRNLEHVYGVFEVADEILRSTAAALPAPVTKQSNGRPKRPGIDRAALAHSRVRSGLSFAELAKQLRLLPREFSTIVSTRTLRRWETPGGHSPSARDVEALRIVLRLEPGELDVKVAP